MFVTKEGCDTASSRLFRFELGHRQPFHKKNTFYSAYKNGKLVLLKPFVEFTFNDLRRVNKLLKLKFLVDNF